MPWHYGAWLGREAFATVLALANVPEASITFCHLALVLATLALCAALAATLTTAFYACR